MVKLAVQLGRVALAALLACAVGGCSQAIVFGTSSSLGIDIGVEGGQENAKIAYDRTEAVSMPVRRKDGTLVDEAFPVLAISAMDTGKLTLTGLTAAKVKQVFAAGNAATDDNAWESVVTSFDPVAATAVYGRDASSPCIEEWLKSDPTTHAAELKAWWTQQGLTGFPNILISGKEYKDKRVQFIKDKSINCAS